MKKLTKEFLYAGLLILGVDLIILLITGGSFLNAVITLFGVLLLVAALALRIMRWIAE